MGLKVACKRSSVASFSVLSTSFPPSRGALEGLLKRLILHRFPAQLEDFSIVVWLKRVVRRGFVAAFKTTLLAAVQQDPTLFGTLLYPYRLEQAPALAGAVSGKHVHMQAVQTVGTVVSHTPILERQNFAPTVQAGEGVVGSLNGETIHPLECIG